MPHVEDALKRSLAELLETLARERGAELPGGAEALVALEPPRDRTHGDLTTNAAMRAAKFLRTPPPALADEIVRRLALPPGVAAAERAGPGFLNFRLSAGSLADGLARVFAEGPRFGAVDLGRGRTANIEFSSVNPTGPISVGHGRQAVLGDVIGNLLAFCGFRVTKEYYCNDTGAQVRKLGESIVARARQFADPGHPFPEDGYHGDYVIDLARRAIERFGPDFPGRADAVPLAGDFAKSALLEEILEDCRKLKVVHDVVSSEERLHREGLVKATLDDLLARGMAYEKDGATWLRSTAFGDDKDRVLVKSDGSSTYALNDAAYHKTKVDRRFDLIVDLFGADHHGYRPRLAALIRCLGVPPEGFEILIHQFVTVLRDGKTVRMSKRAATYITLRELLEEVEADVVRYYFLERKMDAQVDFDIETAKRTSMDNPSYYLKYGHARCRSILREAEGRGVDTSDAALLAGGAKDLVDRLSHEREVELLKAALSLPDVVERACRAYAPHLLVHYLNDLAQLFQSYYTAGKRDDRFRVVVDDPADTRARLALTRVVQIALGNGLALLGMEAPERM